MKTRLQDYLIMVISHAIGWGWACLIIGYRSLETARSLFLLEGKAKWVLKKLASAKPYK